MAILDEILDRKRRELDLALTEQSAEEMAAAASRTDTPPRGLRRALIESPPPAIIAELKRRSPSRGLLRADFDPASLAAAFHDAGAAALSVLTDEQFFGGSLDDLRTVRAAVDLPLLRKDFVIDRYQIDEARCAGADAVLLIAAALSAEALEGLQKHALSLGLDVLVEVHDEAELDIAVSVGAQLIGVNNRNLRTFEVDVAATERLAPRLAESSAHEALLVAESGIRSAEDVIRLEAVGARAFLVGESLMREADVGLAVRRLRRSE